MHHLSGSSFPLSSLPLTAMAGAKARCRGGPNRHLRFKDRAATRNNLVGAMGCAADGASSSGNCEIRKIDTSNL
jgi:hypothetical protein